MRKFKATDGFPTSEAYQVRTRSPILRQRTQHKTLARFMPDRCRQMGRLCSEGQAVACTTLASVRSSAAFRLTCNCSFSVQKQDDSLWLLIPPGSKPTQGKKTIISPCWPCPKGEPRHGFIAENVELNSSLSRLPAPLRIPAYPLE